MRCTEHKREFNCPCNWCGKKLCEMCIAKQEGKKYYCEHCAVSLVPYKIERRPVMAAPKMEAPVQQQQPQAVKRRFVMGKDGYFELK
jgi:hypothetical protein